MKNYDTQVKSIYEAIGVYCVEFERMAEGMRGCITVVLDCGDNSAQRKVYILLSGITASPIKDKFYRVMTDYLDDLEDIKVIKALKKIIEKQITYRNQTIHAYMFVGYGNEDTKDYSQFSKMTVMRDGLHFAEETCDNINSNIKILKQLNSLLLRLRCCLSFRDLSIKGNVAIPDEWI